MTVHHSRFQARAVAVLVSGVCAFASLPALAQDDLTQSGFYGALGAGVNLPTDSSAHIQNNVNGANTPTTFGFGTGYNFLGALGYKWGSHVRTELEFDYRHADVDHFASASANGGQRVFSFSGNVLYDINLSRYVVPYLGGGLGVARNHWSSVNAGFNSANFDGSDTKLQWQAIGGLGFPINHAVSLYVDYRYIGTGTSNYNGTFSQIVHAPERSQNVMAGLRLFF